MRLDTEVGSECSGQTRKKMEMTGVTGFGNIWKDLGLIGFEENTETKQYVVHVHVCALALLVGWQQGQSVNLLNCSVPSFTPNPLVKCSFHIAPWLGSFAN